MKEAEARGAEKKPYRVLMHNATCLNYTETFIYRQVQGIAQAFEVYFLTDRIVDQHPNYDQISNITLIRDSWLRTIVVRWFKIDHFFLRYSKRKVDRLERFIRKHDIRLIHSQFGINAVKLLPLLERNPTLPCIVTFWGFDASRKLSNQRYTKRLRALFSLPNVTYHSVTGALYPNLYPLGLDPAKAFVQHNGVATAKIEWLKKRTINEKRSKGKVIRLLQVGRFVAKKGHMLSLEVFKKLLDNHTDLSIELRFIGSGGGQEDRCKRFASDHQLGDHVKFLGKMNEKQLIEQYHECDLLLVPSITPKSGDMEGVPTVICEAMAAGCLVLASAHSGIPDIVKDGVTGYLIPEGDTVAFYTKLLEAFSADERPLLVNARAKVVEEYNLSTLNDQLVKQYHEQIDKSER